MLSLVRHSIGSPLYFVVHAEDISERKQVEQALRESEGQFRIMAEGCPAMLWVTDVTGANRFVNRAVRQYFGLPAEGLEERNWEKIVHPADAPVTQEQIRAWRDDRMLASRTRQA